VPKKRRPRHPPPSPLEQFFSGLKDTVLDFVEDAAYDLQDALYQQQEAAQDQSRVNPPKSAQEAAQGRPKVSKRPRVPVQVPTLTHYSVLGVAPTAPQEVIQAAYRALSRIYHPDVPRTGNAEKMKKLNRAYEVLKDPGQRAEYNKLFNL